MIGYQKYQANQVEGAGPLGLILLTYEALYKSLAQARLAIQANDLQTETAYTSRALEAIIELSSSLDQTKGGDIAINLAHLYAYLAKRLGEGMCSCSTEAIDEVMALTQSLREGWLELERLQKTDSTAEISQQQSAVPMIAYAG